MNSVVDTVIKERKETGRVGEVGDLLDLMLASQEDPSTGLTDENIRYQIITFLIAGHETTSCLLYTSPSPRDKRQSRMPSSA